MGARICGSEARGLDASVDLRRRDRCMSEQLLDGAQVGSTLEQVRGERVAQGVRMDRGQARSPPWQAGMQKNQ